MGFRIREDRRPQGPSGREPLPAAPGGLLAATRVALHTVTLDHNGTFEAALPLTKDAMYFNVSAQHVTAGPSTRAAS